MHAEACAYEVYPGSQHFFTGYELLSPSFFLLWLWTVVVITGTLVTATFSLGTRRG